MKQNTTKTPNTHRQLRISSQTGNYDFLGTGGVGQPNPCRNCPCAWFIPCCRDDGVSAGTVNEWTPCVNIYWGVQRFTGILLILFTIGMISFLAYSMSKVSLPSEAPDLLPDWTNMGLIEAALDETSICDSCLSTGHSASSISFAPPTTSGPTKMPTTPSPTHRPTDPTPRPTSRPTPKPSIRPTGRPTQSPTDQPSSNPTGTPSKQPSESPTDRPTVKPTNRPTTANPTSAPTTYQATNVDTNTTVASYSTTSQIHPTTDPTEREPGQPTAMPTIPTAQPTTSPTKPPSNHPTVIPTATPTVIPSTQPSTIPSISPTDFPSTIPTEQPTNVPSKVPTASPVDRNSELAKDASMKILLVFGAKSASGYGSSCDDSISPDAKVKFDDNFDIFDTGTQMKGLWLCDELDRLKIDEPIMVRTSNQEVCLWREFYNYAYLNLNNETVGSLLSEWPATSQTEMLDAIESWMEGPGGDYSSYFGVDTDELKITWLKQPVYTQMNLNWGVEKMYEYFLKWEDFMDNFNNNDTFTSTKFRGFQFSSSYVLMEVELEFLAGFYKSIGYTLCLCTLTILIFTMNFMIVFLVCLYIMMVVVCVVGIYGAFGWEFGAIEVIAVPTVVGLSIDYALHITHSYIHSIYDDRISRAKNSVANIGCSVFASALTTISSMLVLYFAVVLLFSNLGWIVGVTTSCGICMAIFVCPPLLSYIGPQKDDCNVQKCFKNLFKWCKSDDKLSSCRNCDTDCKNCRKSSYQVMNLPDSTRNDEIATIDDAGTATTATATTHMSGDTTQDKQGPHHKKLNIKANLTKFKKKHMPGGKNSETDVNNNGIELTTNGIGNGSGGVAQYQQLGSQSNINIANGNDENDLELENNDEHDRDRDANTHSHSHVHARAHAIAQGLAHGLAHGGVKKPKVSASSLLSENQQE